MHKLTDQLDPHTAGTVALMGVARAALGALRLAIADLPTMPKEATRAVHEQANLLSKTADSLAKKLDTLPDDLRPVEEHDSETVNLAEVTDLLQRLKQASDGQVCGGCGSILTYDGTHKTDTA